MPIGLGGVILVRGRRGVWVTGDLGSERGVSPLGVAGGNERCSIQWEHHRGIEREHVTGKPNTEMTSTQRLAWRTYKRFEKRHGVAPSVRQYMAALGTASYGGAQRLLEIFRTRGLIKAGVPHVPTITQTRLTAKGRKAQ